MNVLPSLVPWFQDLAVSIHKDYAFKQKSLNVFLICVSGENFLSHLKEHSAEVCTRNC